MITGLKPYPAMKDSGVEWLGEVPEHWEVRRLKVDVVNVVDQTTGRSTGESYVALEHVESWTGRIREAELDASFDSQVKRFRAGDVLFGKLRPYLAKVARPDRRGVCVGEFLVLRPRSSETNNGYLEQFLRSKPIIDVINASTVGAKMPRADWTFIGNLKQLLPPLPEQAAIVCYLDYVDHRVQRFVRAKQKLIGLLEEEKKAVIHRAVTRGIDPDVRLKDSGIEWLGEVPKHWEVRRNGRLFSQRKETGFADLPILEVSLRTGVRVRDFNNSDRKQVMSDRDKYKRAVSGDIAYNMMRMWQGAVGVAPTDGLISPAYVVAKPLPETESRYFIHLFRTAAYMAEIDKYSRGIVKDRNRLYWEDFKRMPSCYPPHHEQVAIADAIDRICNDIDATVDRAHREIELLHEYHTRLIADVVTGKRDVREAVSALPDVDLQADEHEPDDTLNDDAKANLDELDATLKEAKV